MSAAIEMRGVTAGYGRVTALRDVDLTLEVGSVAALLGPNGAGKTTLLRTLAGLVRPSAGTVHVHGEAVTRRAVHSRVRSGLCLIPEGRGIFPSLTVRDNLRLQASSRADEEDGIERALDAFPALRGRLATRAGSLSGGQQQMVALSRCFVSRPSVVALDEVSMGLAPRVIDEIFAALRRLADEGVALLIVEQYVTRALAMSDTVHLINRGRLTFSGRPDEVDEERVVAGYLGTDTRSVSGSSMEET
jgi:branched-chain amino acid transport system ATP-binding protein